MSLDSTPFYQLRLRAEESPIGLHHKDVQPNALRPRELIEGFALTRLEMV
jgi:hypothetical protein